MLRQVHAETNETIRRVLDLDEPVNVTPVPPAPDRAPLLCLDDSGFLTSVDEQALLDAAMRTGTIVRFDRLPGDTLVVGTPIAQAWTLQDAGGITETQRKALTAVHGLGHIAALMCELAGYDLGPRLLWDDDGRVRQMLRRPDFAEMLDLAVGQPCRYGTTEPAVLSRLFVILREIAGLLPAEPHVARWPRKSTG